VIAVGCLIIPVLLAAGIAAGWAIGGRDGAVTGGIGGGIAGAAGVLALLWGWARIRNRGV
jgi:hypothetical protein